MQAVDPHNLSKLASSSDWQIAICPAVFIAASTKQAYSCALRKAVCCAAALLHRRNVQSAAQCTDNIPFSSSGWRRQADEAVRPAGPHTACSKPAAPRRGANATRAHVDILLEDKVDRPAASASGEPAWQQEIPDCSALCRISQQSMQSIMGPRRQRRVLLAMWSAGRPASVLTSMS